MKHTVQFIVALAASLVTLFLGFASNSEKPSALALQDATPSADFVLPPDLSDALRRPVVEEEIVHEAMERSFPIDAIGEFDQGAMLDRITRERAAGAVASAIIEHYGAGEAFYSNHGGEEYRLTNGHLASEDESFIYLRYDINHKATRGPIQYSQSGLIQLRFGNWHYQNGSACAPVRSIKVVGLDLRNVPNWYDTGILEDWVQDDLRTHSDQYGVDLICGFYS